jgi:hypothetical protein
MACLITPVLLHMTYMGPDPTHDASKAIKVLQNRLTPHIQRGHFLLTDPSGPADRAPAKPRLKMRSGNGTGVLSLRSSPENKPLVY